MIWQNELIQLGREKTMCGILGVMATSPVNQLLYDGLMVFQHRGQDAAGIATAEGNTFHPQKGPGLVRDVFRTRNMRALPGNWGIGHVRYPTAGSATNFAEAQPLYGVNLPFGIVLGHNGNLTNADQLKDEMFRLDRRHINTNSDSEVPLNVLAHELQCLAHGYELMDEDSIFQAVAGVRIAVAGGLCRGCPDRRLWFASLPRSAWYPATGLWPELDAGRHGISGGFRVCGNSIRWASRWCAYRTG